MLKEDHMEARRVGADHVELLRRWVLGVLALGLAGTVGSLRALEIIMMLFVVAGFAGIAAHFRGSAEFQLDLNPSMTAWELVEKVMRAKAPPLLAPGMMLQMGLLGLAYVYSDVRYIARIQRVFRSKPGKE
jgi:hypothetical protein